MVEVLATNITSPLGSTSRQNYAAVKEGRSALGPLTGWKGIPEKITASVFAGEADFESIAIASIAEALGHCSVDSTSERTLLVLSTTKGDIERLSDSYEGLAAAARRIAAHFGIITSPIIVCNACISGANAQLIAARLIEKGKYDTAIVCGADMVSAFTATGFLSFKALSPEECRPFDIERLGLNLGEASATMILDRTDKDAADSGRWVLEAGAQTNDAFHVSAPSPDGNGVYRALASVMEGTCGDELDCVCVHGTATMFNDQMESKAVQKAGLGDTPAIALKGYFGHTLGAAGLIETIITMLALEDGIILPTRGYNEIGVSGKISISSLPRPARRQGRFVKVLSGFGGCNCALRYSIARTAKPASLVETGLIKTLAQVHLNSYDNISEIYKSRIGNYPKFYKMDMLTKLAFVASELLMQEVPDAAPLAVILFNGASTIVQDRRHVESFAGVEGFFPSPSVFLYTLPNIAVGEIAIRHGIKGETGLYILQEKDWNLMETIIGASLPKSATAISGWVDCRTENDYEADLKLITTK